MKKNIKIIMGVIVSLFIIIVGLFGYNCIDKPYNENLLNKLNGDILYLKRDTDLVMKIYKSNANLKDEQLIYAYNEYSDNNNILSIDYDKDRDVIRFVAYDKNVSNWMQFELDRNGEVTPLNIKGFLEESYVDKVKTDKYEVESINGSLYIKDKEANKTELLKRYIGIYDSKFSGGYNPVKLSDDNKYLFFTYNGHQTPIGVILESLIFQDNCYKMYVMNLDTKEISRYIDFEEIISLD